MKLLEWSSLKNFRIDEFREPDNMSRAFLEKLDRARSRAGREFRITSDYRRGAGSHSEGVAVDISVKDSRERFEIVRALIREGFERIGVYDRHIHVDDSKRLDTQVLWIGVSQ